jgi:hypothetical protein
MNQSKCLEIGTVVIALSAGACSSSSDDRTTGGSTNPSTTPTMTMTSNAGTGAGVNAGACANDLGLKFTPMYSAYIGPTRKFQVPVEVSGVDAASVTWSASKQGLVDIEKTSKGAMLTTRAAGEVDIIARSADKCGTSKLTIYQATEELWEIGRKRYNDAPTIPAGGLDADAGPPPQAAIAKLACTTCHGESSQGNPNAPFWNVSHTPTQIGGISDEELINLFTKAILPPTYMLTFVPAAFLSQWATNHMWEMTPEETRGIAVYLRALPPTEQKAQLNMEFLRRLQQMGATPPGGADAGRP